MRSILFAAGIAAGLVLNAPAALAQGTGPYPAIHETDPALPDHVIFRPRDLGPFSAARPLPVLAWSNGGCAKVGTYTSFLEEVASHGYLVIAAGTAAPARAVQAAPPAAAPAQRLTLSARFKRIAPPQTTTYQMLEGAYWLAAEGRRKGGRFEGKVDAAKLAVAGHSCGGMQALEASLDPRVTTTLVLASGVWRQGGDLAGITLNRQTLQQLHAPTLYLTGGDGDIAHPNAEGDFLEIDHIPVFKAFQAPAPHALTLRDPNGGAYGKVVVDWLDWRLRGEATAARVFTGANCGLCRDSAWDVEKKRID